MNATYGKAEVLTIIRLEKLPWAGHLHIIDNVSISNGVFKAKIDGSGPIGKARKRTPTLKYY